ncbi:hypothetical protein SESBI_48423 [Sesbania bispinosa]|nr:hypothetical protein SESBI_48423 [Sesbania bispinosa]
MAGPFDMISNIFPGRDTWRLKVPIGRLWNMTPIDDPVKPFSVQMILVDAEGGRIQAGIKKHLMRKFANLLVEGAVYKMAYFEVVRNLGSYRATEHEFRLFFDSRTRVVPTESELIPRFGFSLKNTQDVVDTKGKSDYLMDFMGVLLAVSNEKRIMKEGKLTRVIVLELADEKGRIRCSLFGDFVDMVTNFLSEGKNELPIIIIQLARVSSYKGSIVLQNVMNATKLFWNPQIPEAVDFKNGISSNDIDIDVSVGLIEDNTRVMSLKEEFLDAYPRKTISQLQYILEEGMYIVSGTVERVSEEGLWWYMGGKCQRSVIQDAGGFYCSWCETIVYEVTPRYKLLLEVNDGQEKANFMIFDTDVYSVLQISCKDLMSGMKDLELGPYPEEFKKFLGMECLFKVQIKGNCQTTYGDAFTVKKLCYQEDIVQGFKDENTIRTPEMLKFNPPFTKMQTVASSSAPLSDVTADQLGDSECQVSLNELQESTIHSGDVLFADKRKVDVEGSPPQVPRKRCRVKSIKLERT